MTRPHIPIVVGATLLLSATVGWAVDSVETVQQGSSFRASVSCTTEAHTPIAPQSLTYAVFRKGSTTPTYGPVTLTQGLSETTNIDVPGDSTLNVGQPAVGDTVPFLFVWSWPIAEGRRGTKAVEFPVQRIPVVRQVIPIPNP